MKSGKILVNLILLIVLLLLGFGYLTLENEPSELIKGFIKDSDVDSLKKYSETLITKFAPEPSWLEGRTFIRSDLPQPEIVGKSAILVEINSGDILYELNSKEKKPIASLVKIMTAVVALKHKNLDDKVYISKDAASIGENSMLLSAGEVFTLENLLYGLVLHSGNDAAYAIAEEVAGNSDRFVEWMNIKAKELGMNDTKFTDPSGLDDATYSTPIDLIKLTRYALKNPNFRKIASTVEYEIYGSEEHKYIYLYNQTNLLTTYPGVAGIKTGFTEEAGLSLVTYAENGGREVVGVVLNSTDRKGDMIRILDHGFETLGVQIEHNLL